MATIGLLENGPMFDWSRDSNMYKNYLAWKQWVEDAVQFSFAYYR